MMKANLTKTYLNGRLTHHHHFGALNRLESVFNYEQGKGMTYDYNGLGHRVGKHIGLSSEPLTSEKTFEEIVLNNQTHIADVIDLTKPFHNLLRRTNADVIDAQQNEYDKTHTNFIYDFGVLSAQNGDAPLYYLHDELGSPIRITSDHWINEEAFAYDEFGNSLHKETSNQPFGFTGYQYDDVAGSYFAQARQYDPTIGRFVSEDIVGGFTHSPFTLNAYTYCWNDPMNLVDLDGLFPQWLRNLWNDVRGIPRDLWRALHVLGDGPANGFYWNSVSPTMALANERYESANEFAQRHQVTDPVYHHIINARWNLADAYRHFSWMFEETVARGASGARFIGDHNEIAFVETRFRISSLFSNNRRVISGRFDVDTLMDLWNNSVGIEMGACPDQQDRSSYEAFWYAQENGWLIDDIRYAPERLGIVPYGGINGTVTGVWDLNANSIQLTDQYGTTINLCLYTREITQ